MKVTARVAQQEDIKAFAEWAAGNGDIPAEDIQAVAKAKCPLVLVVEVDGQPELYIPLLPAMTIAYLGFRPGQSPRVKAKAMQGMLEAIKNVQQSLGIEDTYVFTKAEYPMGKWALKHGFVEKSKTGFSLEKK